MELRLGLCRLSTDMYESRGDRGIQGRLGIVKIQKFIYYGCAMPPPMTPGHPQPSINYSQHRKFHETSCVGPSLNCMNHIFLSLKIIN